MAVGRRCHDPVICPLRTCARIVAWREILACRRLPRNARCFTLRAGDLAYAPPGAAHRLTNESEEETRLLGIFVPAGPEKAMSAWAQLMARSGANPDPDELEAVRAMGLAIEVEAPRLQADA